MNTINQSTKFFQGILVFVLVLNILVPNVLAGPVVSSADILPEEPTYTDQEVLHAGNKTILLPRTSINASELALIVNDSDPQSVQVASYYQQVRNIPSANVIHVNFTPGNTIMSASEFISIKNQVDLLTPPSVQAYAITWTTPYRVSNCLSITFAFTFGYQANWDSGCSGVPGNSPYYNSSSVRPFDDLGIRPAMALAGTSFQNVRTMVDRGLLAHQNFPHGDGYFVRTSDVYRSARWSWFQEAVNFWNRPEALHMTYIDNSSSGSGYIQNTPNVLFYQESLESVPAITTNTYVPGSVADHMTSWGGMLTDSPQMSILRWLEAGATGSYGTVVEPGAWGNKFPDPRPLVEHYFRGNTLVEAYTKSIMSLPVTGIFVGDPLARPFGSTASLSNGTLTINTTIMKPGINYVLYGANSIFGPFQQVQALPVLANYQFSTISIPNATYNVYKLVELPDTNPPPIPVLSVSTYGGISYHWTTVWDVNGVTYHFQFDNNQDFSSPLRDYSNLTQNFFGIPASDFPNGTYYGRVRAEDRSPNHNPSAWSNVVPITIGNGGDTIPPAVTLTAPTPGTNVSGNVDVRSTATDNVGVTEVKLYVDGGYVDHSTSSPFTVRWNTHQVSRGQHSIQTRAYDAAENNTFSQSVTVNRT